jgi:uroporphyrin-III C-methyltransferase/precorrin-2 dehydrogenase/sirohydrochlorin ferrochelatase
MFPVAVALRGRPCLVVGGGGVALRKVHSLLGEGARVTVVAPAVCEELEGLAEAGRVQWEKRPYRAGEAASYWLVFAATDDRTVNQQVFHDGERGGVLVNVVDDPELCSFHVPARLRRGSLDIALASQGEAPFLVRRLRQVLERHFGPEWGEWVQAAARFRAAVRQVPREGSEVEALFDRFFASTLDAERLQVRVPTAEELAAWLGGTDSAAGTPPQPVGADSGTAPRPGLVSLVGSGPGDPGLLTLKGRKRLFSAHAVVYDRLAGNALPSDLPASVELYPVGKEAGHHPVPQEEINQLLVRLARQGKRVVRFKGGDPYVFGRGGEEAEALVAAGIPFEVVPGITAAVGAAAYAGIPVTHRGEAMRLTLVTAHEAAKPEGPQVRWDLLAADPQATIAGYMGVASLAQVVQQLLAAGMDPRTPAALVERGTTAHQRTVRAELAALPERAAALGVQPPAVFLIGRTVTHMDRLGWFALQPLAGERVVVPARQGEAAAQLEAAGAELVVVPSPPTPATVVAAAASPVTSCVAGSAAEVEELHWCRERGAWSGRVQVLCLSREAAGRAREVALGHVIQVADPEELVASLGRREHAGSQDF